MRRILRILSLAVLFCAIVCLGGCVRRVAVLIPPGEPVQLAEDAKARVYVTIDGKRVRSDNRVTIPEGWWSLPDTEK